MCSGPSSGQVAAQQSQTDYTNQLMNIMKTEFANQQSVLSYILPQLQAMATNPQGFGATEYKNLQSQIVNNVGAQFAGAQKAANENFAVSNEAGLPSGVQSQVNAQISANASGAESSNLTSLSIQNEQLKQQQQQYALGGLTSIAGTSGQQTIGAGGVGSGSAGQQFGEATTMANMGNWWQPILGAALGTGLSAATGGLSNLIARPGQSGVTPTGISGAQYS